jgi:hypothetical protein
MRLQEMVQNVQQHQHLLLVTLGELGLANVIDDYIPNFFAPVLLRQQILSKRSRNDFGKMLVLSDREHSSSVNPQNPTQSSSVIMFHLSVQVCSLVKP